MVIEMTIFIESSDLERERFQRKTCSFISSEVPDLAHAFDSGDEWGSRILPSGPWH